MIIAIDGPAAAGKGTLARRLAGHLNLAYLDTGLIYRAVGKKVLTRGVELENELAAQAVARTLCSEDLKMDGLRTDEVAQAASKISAFSSVRDVLLNFQRQFATNPPAEKSGAVLDGRDIGTVVCSNAEYKLFITASVEVRAQRRVKELQERGLPAIYARVFRDMTERDARDSKRAVSPLEPAVDAHTVDTSRLNREQVFAIALERLGLPDS